MTEQREEITFAVRVMSGLYPAGWTVEDLRTAAPDVPTLTLNATLASWVSSGRLRVVGEETARHRSAKARKIKVYSSPETV